MELEGGSLLQWGVKGMALKGFVYQAGQELDAGIMGSLQRSLRHQSGVLKIVFFFFLNVYLFLRQREAEYERGRGRERGRHRIRSRLQALSHQPRARRGA